MKNAKYPTVTTVQKFKRNSKKEDKSIPLTHNYMTGHFAGTQVIIIFPLNFPLEME
jgi:hypothetical protein